MKSVPKRWFRIQAELINTHDAFVRVSRSISHSLCEHFSFLLRLPFFTIISKKTFFFNPQTQMKMLNSVDPFVHRFTMIDCVRRCGFSRIWCFNYSCMRMLLYAIFMLSWLHSRLWISVQKKWKKMERSRRFVADGIQSFVCVMRCVKTFVDVQSK